MYDENLDTAFNLCECSSAWLTSLLFDSATFQMSQDQIDQILIVKQVILRELGVKISGTDNFASMNYTCNSELTVHIFVSVFRIECISCVFVVTWGPWGLGPKHLEEINVQGNIG